VRRLNNFRASGDTSLLPWVLSQKESSNHMSGGVILHHILIAITPSPLLADFVNELSKSTYRSSRRVLTSKDAAYSK
jgi:hypothetical protein